MSAPLPILKSIENTFSVGRRKEDLNLAPTSDQLMSNSLPNKREHLTISKPWLLPESWPRQPIKFQGSRRMTMFSSLYVVVGCLSFLLQSYTLKFLRLFRKKLMLSILPRIRISSSHSELLTQYCHRQALVFFY